MLRTTLLPESISAELAPYLVRSRDEIVALMGALCRDGIPVTCFIEGGFIPAEARIAAALPASDELVLAALSEVEQGILSTASAMSVVAHLRGVKIQFATSAIESVPIASGVGVRVLMPTEVLRLQRRGQARVKPSRLRPLECMVRGELNMPSLLRMTVLDIGRGGVALLARARDTYRVGQQLLNCSFDLAEDGEFTTNLNVRHVERIEGLGGWCYGCSYAGISAAALARVSRYVERIEMRRRETLAEVA